MSLGVSPAHGTAHAVPSPAQQRLRAPAHKVKGKSSSSPPKPSRHCSLSSPRAGAYGKPTTAERGLQHGWDFPTETPVSTALSNGRSASLSVTCGDEFSLF